MDFLFLRLGGGGAHICVYVYMKKTKQLKGRGGGEKHTTGVLWSQVLDPTRRCASESTSWMCSATKAKKETTCNGWSQSLLGEVEVYCRHFSTAVNRGSLSCWERRPAAAPMATPQHLFRHPAGSLTCRGQKRYCGSGHGGGAGKEWSL